MPQTFNIKNNNDEPQINCDQLKTYDMICHLLDERHNIAQNFEISKLTRWVKSKESWKPLKEGFAQIFGSKKMSRRNLDYIKRIKTFGKFSCEVLIAAALLYCRVLFELRESPELVEICNLKVYATCISLVQKNVLDFYNPHHMMAKILGIKPKKLGLMELFLLHNILNFNHSVTCEDLHQFTLWMVELS